MKCQYHKTGLPEADLDYEICNNKAIHDIKITHTELWPDVDKDIVEGIYRFCDEHFKRHFSIRTVHDLGRTYQTKFPYFQTGGLGYFSQEVLAEIEKKNKSSIMTVVT